MLFNRTLAALLTLFVLLANGRLLHAQESSANKMPQTGDTINVGANQTLSSLRITKTKLTLAGKITGDLDATDCVVIILPGGKIGGTLTLRGGSLQNQTVNATRVKALPAAASVSDETEPVTVTAPLSGSPASFGATVAPVVNTDLMLTGTNEGVSTSPRPQSRKDWIGAQLALLVLGLLAGAVARIAAPRAANRAAATVGAQPGRCLLVGAASVVGLGVISLINAGVMATPIKPLWLPVGFAVASGVLVLLAFGWLCGMRAVGEVVAAKTGRDSSGDFLIRLAVGLSVFFLLNTALGITAPWLGAIGLIAQLVVSVMGLGAAVITGLGRNENWLGAKTRGRC